MTGSINSVPELSAALNTSPPSDSPQTPRTEDGTTPSGRLGYPLSHQTHRNERPLAFVLPQIYGDTPDFGQSLNNFHGSDIFATPKYARPHEDFGTNATGSPAPRGQALYQNHHQNHHQVNNTKPDHVDVTYPFGDQVPFKASNTTQHWAGQKQVARPLRHVDLSMPYPTVLQSAAQSMMGLVQPSPEMTPAILDTPQYHQTTPESTLRRPVAYTNQLAQELRELATTSSFLRPPPGLPFPAQAPAPIREPIAAPAPTLSNQVSKFRPMAALGTLGRTSNPVNALGVVPVDQATFSDNYRGEHNWRNASAVGLPEKENCALWLTNLPADVTHHELLTPIRNIGRIWCTVINAPDFVRHETAAAKVVFSNPKSASALLEQSNSRGFLIRNHHIRITRNRVKYPEKAMSGKESRVLIITGKSSFVNEASLTEFFREKFIYEIDEVISLIVNAAGRSVVEYKFGSYRSQAQMGKMALEKDRPEGFEKVEFGEDPCEVGDTLSSYEIAGRRIVGRSD